jgi:class 3 adenylate cyclase
VNRQIFCLLLCFTLLPSLSVLYAQSAHPRLDSLLARVSKVNDDSGKARLANDLAQEYQRVNAGEGVKWAHNSLELSRRLHWRKGEALAYKALGNNYQARGSFPEALDAFFQSLKISEELGDRSTIGRLYNNIGLLYKDQKQYAKSEDYYLKSLKVAEETGDRQSLEIRLGNIAVVYLEQGRFAEGLEYQKRSLGIAREIKDEVGISMQTANIGSTYSAMKRHNEALAYELEALRIQKAAGDKWGVAINLGNIGTSYVSIARDSAAPMADSLVSASRQANLAKGIAYLQEAINDARELGILSSISQFSEVLSQALAMQGNYKGALEVYRQGIEAKDSLFTTANNEKLATLETQRALQLKDKDLQIARLEVSKKRNERFGFIAGIVLLLITTIILLRSFRKQKQSNHLLSKEKQRSDDLLLNILPSEVAEELKEKGEANARHFEHVSVLFTDFVNFTGTAEQLSPQALVRELHECFSAFDTIIERNGLEKIKTVGDAYIAVGGLPLPDERHAQRCVQAGLEILQFMEERKKKERVFEIRVGINSGSVVAGIVGVKKFAYDIWGDTVNTAARMEQHGSPGRLNISQSTYELVKDDFHCTRRGMIAAKNKGDIEMYFVDAAITDTVLKTV